MTVIVLAGAEYDIQDLAIKQVREIDWRFLRVSEAYYDRTKFTEQSRQDIFDIIYYALTHGNPALTKAEFETLNISLPEALKYIGVIVNHTHMFKPAAEATPNTGEAQSTGTAL